METTFSNNYMKYDVKTSNKSSCGLQALNKFYEIILLNVHLCVIHPHKCNIWRVY